MHLQLVAEDSFLFHNKEFQHTDLSFLLVDRSVVWLLVKQWFVLVFFPSLGEKNCRPSHQNLKNLMGRFRRPLRVSSSPELRVSEYE